MNKIIIWYSQTSHITVFLNSNEVCTKFETLIKFLTTQQKIENLEVL